MAFGKKRQKEIDDIKKAIQDIIDLRKEHKENGEEFPSYYVDYEKEREEEIKVLEAKQAAPRKPRILKKDKIIESAKALLCEQVCATCRHNHYDVRCKRRKGYATSFRVKPQTEWPCKKYEAKNE